MTAKELSNRMNTVAHTILMRCYGSGNAIATTDTNAERYLIEHGYTAYSQKPMMVLTYAGRGYAEREMAWAKRKGLNR
jgi:hypothetical protein